MKTREIVTMVTGAIVMILIASAVLVPIVSNATADADTYVNDGYYRMDYVDSGETVVVNWSATDPYTLVVDGVSMDVSAIKERSNGSSIFVDSLGVIRMILYDNGNVAIRSFHSTGYYSVDSTNVSNSATFSISESSIVATLVNDGESTSRTISSLSDVMVIDSDGKYVMKKGKAYVNGDSTIIFAGLTNLGGADFGYRGVGSIEGGFTNSFFYGDNRNPSITDLVLDAVESNNHVDLYIFDEMTFEATIDNASGEGTTTAEILYDSFIVPVEVSADRTNPLTGVLVTILDVLPIVVFIGLLLGIVAYMRLRT